MPDTTTLHSNESGFWSVSSVTDSLRMMNGEQTIEELEEMRKQRLIQKEVAILRRLKDNFSKISEAQIEAVLKVFNTQKKKIEKADITIGSDPEICLLNNDGGILPASHFISDSDRNKAFGLDGHSATAEIRPKFSTSPLVHAEIIKETLENGIKQYNLGGYQLFTAHQEASIGGHVQIGHPYLTNSSYLLKGLTDKDLADALIKVNQQDTQTKLHILNYVNRITSPSFSPGNKTTDLLATLSSRNLINAEYLTESLAKLLDRYLAFPILFLEDTDLARKRRTGSYGRLGDYREQDFGMEYRTLPSWLHTKALTEGVLALTYTVADYVLKHEPKPLDYDFTKLPGFQDLFKQHNTAILKPHLKLVSKEIKQLPLYKTYKSKIDYILVNAEKENPLILGDIIKGWKFNIEVAHTIALLTAKELIEALTTQISKRQGADELNPVNFVIGNTPDFAIMGIRNRLNRVLTKLTKATSNPQLPIYIYGKNRDRGHIVTIELPIRMVNRKRTHRLPELINKTAQLMGYTNTINVKMVYHPNNFPATEEPIYTTRLTDPRYLTNVGMSARVGLGREIREHNSYLAEIVTFLVLMFINNSLYKAYKTNRNGKKITLPLLARTFLKPISKLKAKKTISMTPDDNYVI